MRILKRYIEEETPEPLTLTFDKDTGNTDLLKKTKNKDENLFCDRCGYAECACPQQ